MIVALSRGWADTTVILLMLGSWFLGAGMVDVYHRYFDRKERREEALEAAVAARYREHAYDHLIVDEVESDAPMGTFAEPGLRWRGTIPKPVDWSDDADA